MNITAQELHEALHYDPATGVFTWLPREGEDVGTRMFNTRFAGSMAGSVRADPRKRDGTLRYVTINVGRRKLFAHRLAWLYMTGTQPPKAIDHIDGDGTNNAWDNLRDGTKVNNLNQAMRTDNTSGVAGVSRSRGRWRAVVHRNKVQHHLGMFDTLGEATMAVMNARAELGGFSERHGMRG